MPGIALGPTRGGGPASLANTPTASFQTPGLSGPATSGAQASNLPSSYCRGYLLGQGLILAHTACVTHEVRLCNHLCPLLSRGYLGRTVGKVCTGRKTGTHSLDSSSLDTSKLLSYESTQFISHMRAYQISMGKRRNKRMAHYALSSNVWFPIVLRGKRVCTKSVSQQIDSTYY